MQVKIIKNWQVKKIMGTKYFIVTDSFIFLLEHYWNKYTIEVPINFITDFWSIPAIFWFFDKTKYISYIMHDYLYSYIWQIESIKWVYRYDRSLADDILTKWLENEWMNKIWYSIVRIWVEIWWHNHYKKKNKEISELKLKLNIK
jgi:hypothetical protein